MKKISLIELKKYQNEKCYTLFSTMLGSTWWVTSSSGCYPMTMQTDWNLNANNSIIHIIRHFYMDEKHFVWDIKLNEHMHKKLRMKNKRICSQLFFCSVC